MAWTRKTRKTTRASAMVELLVILPVMLLVIVGMLYLGQLSLYKSRAHFGGEYALNTAGDQSEERAERGPVSDLLYPSPAGELAVVEQPAQPAEIPQDGEIRDVFDEMCQPIYSTYATGRYVFSGGTLRFVVSTHQSQRLSRDGRYVEHYKLLEANVPELCTDTLRDWIERHRVDLTYAYVPDYIKVGEWPLEAVELETSLQSVVRGEKKREVTDPPAGMNHPIDALTDNRHMANSGQLPDYPDFSGDESFWEPN